MHLKNKQKSVFNSRDRSSLEMCRVALTESGITRALMPSPTPCSSPSQTSPTLLPMFQVVQTLLYPIFQFQTQSPKIRSRLNNLWKINHETAEKNHSTQKQDFPASCSSKEESINFCPTPKLLWTTRFPLRGTECRNRARPVSLGRAIQKLWKRAFLSEGH